VNLILASILGYILAQLAIAFWFSRRNRSEEDYLLAGRRLGPWMGTFAVFATWYGAETCIGAAGEAYAHGLSGVIADPFGYTLGIVLTGVFFAAALWKRGIVTLADLFRNRFGAGVERLAAIIMIPSSLMWAAAQIRALGQVLASASEWGLIVAITVSAAVVIAYTAVGGMWANAVTDLVQGVVMIAGVLALGAVFVSMGGLERIAALPPERFSFMHERTLLGALNTLAVPIFSTIAAQELASRVLAMRGATLARNATVAAGGVYLVLGVVPVLLGLGAFAFLGDGIDHEQVLSRFAQQNLPLPLYILFLGALVSAILSTLSGALLVAASLTAHNLFVHLHPRMSEPAKLAASRWAVVGLGVIAYLIALSSESVYELVQQSSSLGSSGILVIMVFALWGQRVGHKHSGYAALVTGTATWLLGEHVWELEYAYLLSLFAAFAAYFLVAVLEKKPAHAVT